MPQTAEGGSRPGCYCVKENEQRRRRERGAGWNFSGCHPWGELLLGACSSLRDGEAELGEGSRCSMPLGKKGAAARLQGDAERREQRPTPWLPAAKSSGKKMQQGGSVQSCCARKKTGTKKWRLGRSEGWEWKIAMCKGRGPYL
jgi:hypothetical protein